MKFRWSLFHSVLFPIASLLLILFLPFVARLPQCLRGGINIVQASLGSANKFKTPCLTSNKQISKISGLEKLLSFGTISANQTNLIGFYQEILGSLHAFPKSLEEKIKTFLKSTCNCP